MWHDVVLASSLSSAIVRTMSYTLSFHDLHSVSAPWVTLIRPSYDFVQGCKFDRERMRIWCNVCSISFSIRHEEG